MIRMSTVRAGMALTRCAAVAGLIYTALIAHVRGALIGGLPLALAGCTGAGRPWRRGQRGLRRRRLSPAKGAPGVPLHRALTDEHPAVPRQRGPTNGRVHSRGDHIMSTPTRPPQEAPPHAAQADASRSIADWRQHFPARMNHAGHEVRDVHTLFDERMTVGQRAADAVARRLGSWRFLIIQSAVLAAWIAFNIAEVVFKPFDPYPFIL